MNLLFVGDVIGRPGRAVLRAFLPKITASRAIDIIVANAENAAGGFGLTESVAEELFSMGIHVLTSGNHIWDKKEIVPHLSREPRILRPINYPPGVPGKGSVVVETQGGVKVGVINAQGRVFMPPLDCPFRAVKAEVERLRLEADVLMVDFHAEATSEKIAMCYYLDGRVAAVVGTHTHVQTADERILSNGTACITDVGMTGPVTSVIGVEVEDIVGKFLDQTPRRFTLAGGPSMLSAVMVEVDEELGTARRIERISMTEGGGGGRV